MQGLLLIVPAVLAVLQLTTHRYIFSALVTLCCALIVMIRRPDGGAVIMAAAFVLAAAGDYFLAHQKSRPADFLCGVALFALSHAAFILYAARRFSFRPWAAGVCAALAVIYAIYLSRRGLVGQSAALKAAVSLYALISLTGLFFAFSAKAALGEYVLYALGIACIIFSDTMIAEADFVKNAAARRFILPTYYLCHILLAASRVIGP